ncbi:MAG: Rieske 2Fe-2S domain-containing protein, partial [Verrucomicrobia bacterium]|nr:Rieske 2Fe-2S domain-containing protein [Verrucomicrobiota bacterium]
NPEDGATPLETRQNLNVDALRQVWQDGAAMNESEKQFSFTRAAINTSGRAQNPIPLSYISRRKFLTRSVGAGVLAGACVCGLSSCATFSKIGGTPPLPTNAYAVKPPGRVTVVLKQAKQLAAAGGAAKIIDPALPNPLIIARVADDKYVVAELRCPHRGVELEYQPGNKRFRCASLGHSKFALDGHKLGGPASRGIKVYTASVADGVLTIKLEA